MKGTRKKEEYDVRGFFASSFMSLASTTKIRRTETSRTFEGRSSFQDSGSFISFLHPPSCPCRITSKFDMYISE